METDEIYDKSELLVVLDFINVNSLALWFKRVFRLSLHGFFFGKSVDSDLSVVRLPVNPAKI